MLSPRSRFVPLAIALPLMLGLWLTIGLPIFAELSGAAGGNDAMRDFLFDAGASGATGGNGGDRGPSSPGFVAAAIVDPKVVRQVRLERLLSRTAANVTPRVRTTPHRQAPRERSRRSTPR